MIENSIWDYRNSYLWMDKINKMPPLIITCALNGGIQGKEAHPSIPETPDEIAAQAYEAYNAGASCVHIHSRNPNCLWECAEDAEVYKEINQKVRDRCPDIIINNSTGGGMTTSMEARIRYLDAMPELASLNMGPDMSRIVLKERKEPLEHPHETMEIDACIPFTYGFISTLAQKMLEKGIKPEMEVYHPGHYWSCRELINNNLIKPPYYFQFVMGYQTGIFPTPLNLINIVSELPENSIFSTIGIGKFQWALTTLSIMLGGHVRVGLEDNIYLKRGQLLKGNGEAVEKIVKIAREMNREIATPQQAREMLGISTTPRVY
jgi:3-keto-5-aminohexanoate cleavage enzyme